MSITFFISAALYSLRSFFSWSSFNKIFLSSLRTIFICFSSLGIVRLLYAAVYRPSNSLSWRIYSPLIDFVSKRFHETLLMPRKPVSVWGILYFDAFSSYFNALSLSESSLSAMNFTLAGADFSLLSYTSSALIAFRCLNSLSLVFEIFFCSLRISRYSFSRLAIRSVSVTSFLL